jgi:transporter family-2 protein
LALVFFSGTLMAGQAEINGALSAFLDDPVGAALFSFATGLILVYLKTAFSPKIRQGVKLTLAAVRRRQLPVWYLASGAMGASVVLAQSAAVPVTGVAVFVVAVVAGQVCSGLAVDSFGWGGAERRPASPLRVGGAVMIALATVMTATGDMTGGGLGWLVAVAASVAAGSLVSFQVAWNGSIKRTAGTPWASAVFNFTAGTTVLAVAWLITRLGGPRSGSWPSWPDSWWLYTSGLIGVTVIFLHSWLVRRIGVLALGLAAVTGQLAGALALRAGLPGRSPVTVLVVAGTLAALVGAIIAALPSSRRRPDPDQFKDAAAPTA